MGITDNLWETSLPGCINSAGIAETVCSDLATSDTTAPWGGQLNWGMPIILRGDPNDIRNAQTVALGNALPDFRFAITQTFQWKRLTVYALVDAAIGQDVWNQGFHWAHLDFLSKDVDETGKSVQTAKPIGYYYRAAPPDNSAGLGGFYDILGPNNFTVEDASYAKLRELMVSYHLGPVGGVGDWGVSLVGRNLFTITGYRGFDPEIGIGALAPQPGPAGVHRSARRGQSQQPGPGTRVQQRGRPGAAHQQHLRPGPCRNARRWDRPLRGHQRCPPAAAPGHGDGERVGARELRDGSARRHPAQSDHECARQPGEHRELP